VIKVGTLSEAISGTLGRILWGKLIQVVVISIVALAICGAVSERRLAGVLALFVLARGSFIAREALRERRTDADGQAREPPRTRRELACEFAGLLAFGFLIPIDIVLLTRDFVSSTPEQGWLAPLVVALGFLLYALPFYARQLKVNPELRVLWWGLPFLPALLLVFYGITIEHPYLDPTRDDRAKLAADKVLSHRDNVTASKNAGWVFDYARELEEQGEIEQARHYYRAGLRIAPRSEAAQIRLAALEGRDHEAASLDLGRGVDGESAAEIARRPYWEAGESIPIPPSCELDSSLAQVEGTTAIVIRVGEVPDAISHAIVDVIARELDLSTCLASTRMPLPEHTRVRSLTIGRQWSKGSILESVEREMKSASLPRGPFKYLLVTAVDIYSGGLNFIFSTSYKWGALLSYHRFGDPVRERSRVATRAAKQGLGALLKSFDVPASIDPNCVTSYTNGLAQFDAKGNRPNAETLAIFRRDVDKVDRAWAAYQSR
jgi:predicted Zn-dependent protease